ncbi:MAG: M28 family metallopeptidase [Gammaproteobacteria bacterium]|nr:M28 family metallopeptidase [Gammaproteobacteria bacterium]
MSRHFSELACTAAMSASLLLAGCAPTEISSSTSEVSQAQLRGHIEFLAADSLKGRDTGSVGYQVAADYVAAEFSKLGLKPAGNSGSYFQEVPLVEARRVKGSAGVTLHTSGGDVVLQFPQQFTMRPDLVEASQQLTADLVFVGYGIVADEYDHDDYRGLEVEGKIAVMLTGRPQSWPTEEGAHLGSGRQKARYAAEHGAVGRIIVHTPRDEKVFPYEENFPYLDVPRMNWLDGTGKPDAYWPQLQGDAFLNLDAAAELFAGAPTPLEEIYQADTEGKPVRGFELPGAATLSRQSSHRKLSSPNIVAVLEGSDPKLKQEYLVYSAHLDHLGVIKGENGEDDIYNGAMDNAAGIAIMLETARALQQQPLKRSVLFVAVTGEEKGLLGAGYYARNPTVPRDAMVANINLDMPVLVFPFADVIAFGADHSNLKSTVEKAAHQAGITLTPDPMPEQAIFVRSDHYRFVQQGIPAIYLATGFTSKNPEENGEVLWQKFNKEHYHQASDQADLPIDYESAAIFTQININIGRDICNQEQRPAWNEGDFFGRAFN